MHERPSRKPMRHPGHDYRAPCTVHVTLCTHHRQALFGDVSLAGLRLNGAGQYVDAALQALRSERNGVAIDTHIVMPDHLHAIIMLGTDPGAMVPTSIPELVQAFKMKVFKAWPTGVRRGGWTPYERHLGQRSYYDTLIRNDAHLEKTRAYILANPGRWIERLESQS